MNYQKLMTDSLTSLLDGKEILKCSFLQYCCKEQTFILVTGPCRTIICWEQS